MASKAILQVLMVATLELFYRTPVNFLIVLVYCSAMSYILCLVFMQFLFMKWDLLDFADNTEAFFSWITQIGVVIGISLQKKRLRMIVDQVKIFISSDEFTNKLQQHKIDVIRINKMHVQKPLTYGIMVCGVLNALQPLFKKPLPLGIWTMQKGTGWYKTLLVLEVVTLCPSYFCICSVVCLFLDCCFEITIQYKTMYYNMQMLTTQKDYSEDMFNTYLEQHAFLLRLLKEVAKLFSPIFAVYYACALPMMCIEFYILCESTEYRTLMKYLIFGFARNVEFACFCIPSDYVANEAEKFADHLYSLMWYTNFRKKTCRSLIFAMQRSQQRIRFEAGPLIRVNPTNLLEILKMGWSACAVMKAMKNK